MEAEREIESLMFCITGKKKKINITNKINNIFTISFSPWMPGNQPHSKTAKNHDEDTFNLQSFSSNFTTHPMVLNFPKGPQQDGN